MSNLIELNTELLNKKIQDSETTLVDIFANWCIPCKQLTPIIEDLNNEIGDRILIAKMNADENLDFCKNHNVRNIPTLLLFKKDIVVGRLSGLKTKKEILEFIDKFN